MTTRNQKFITNKNERTIQLISNSITNTLRIASTTIKTNKSILKTQGALGIYNGKTSQGFLIELSNESDVKTAIHEIIHHAQECLFNGKDIHGKTFNKASILVTEILNKKFNLTFAPSFFN